jgi:hypothetical protein
LKNTYSVADIADLAAELIQAHYPHLADVRIEYVWRSTPVTRRDRKALGSASRVSGLSAYLARPEAREFALEPVKRPDAFFVIQIWQQGWAALPDEGKRRCLDTLLRHFRVQEVQNAKSGEVTLSLSLYAPDLEDFADVRSRYPGDEIDYDAIAQKALIQSSGPGKPASEEFSVIGANGKPKRKKRGKPPVAPRVAVSKETRKVGDRVYTLAVTEDGSEYQFMIARAEDGSDNALICVAGRRASSIDEAKQFFDEYVAEQA